MWGSWVRLKDEPFVIVKIFFFGMNSSDQRTRFLIYLQQGPLVRGHEDTYSEDLRSDDSSENPIHPTLARMYAST